jgi:hypothetical protein
MFLCDRFQVEVKTGETLHNRHDASHEVVDMQAASPGDRVICHATRQMAQRVAEALNLAHHHDAAAVQAAGCAAQLAVVSVAGD